MLQYPAIAQRELNPRCIVAKDQELALCLTHMRCVQASSRHPHPSGCRAGSLSRDRDGEQDVRGGNLTERVGPLIILSWQLSMDVPDRRKRACLRLKLRNDPAQVRLTEPSADRELRPFKEGSIDIQRAFRSMIEAS